MMNEKFCPQAIPGRLGRINSFSVSEYVPLCRCDFWSNLYQHGSSSIKNGNSFAGEKLSERKKKQL